MSLSRSRLCLDSMSVCLVWFFNFQESTFSLSLALAVMKRAASFIIGMVMMLQRRMTMMVVMMMEEDHHHFL